MTAVDGKVPLGTASYDVAEESTATLTMPTAVPADAGEVTFTVTPDVGVGPPSPVKVPVQ